MPAVYLIGAPKDDSRSTFLALALSYRPTSRVSWLFPSAVFLSAALLFLVEPMFARMVLPKLGGAPAVWNTCVAFYQTLLLAGYAYAHLLANRLGVRTQIGVHLAIMALAALSMPVGVDATWTVDAAEHPSLTVIRWLVRGLGLPFFVLSASGPLFQHWFALRHGAASNPYRLYAASNAGSLLALLAYPAVIEPLLRLRAQTQLWTWGYAALVLAAAWCGATAWHATPIPRRPRGDAPSDSGLSWVARLRWVGLALVPSSLMLSVTTFISTDIAAIPLLWVVPLAIYLATLIVAFADRGVSLHTTTRVLLPIAIITIVALVVSERVVPVRIAIAAHMGAFALAAWGCHQQLAALRPAVAHLTEFYLWMSAGGALGGAFNTFLAPALFKTPLEYPLVAIAACGLFIAPRPEPSTATARLRAIALTVAPALLIVVLSPLSHRVGWDFLPESTPTRLALVAAPAFVLAIALRTSPLRLGVALALAMLASAWVHIDDRITLHTERTFFGIHRVTDVGFTRVLMSGTTNHGSQAISAALRCEPLSYYTRSGPVGQLFTHLQPRHPGLRLGVVGLGTASMATYTRPTDALTFFEINPAVERLARHPSYFTYLRDCAPQASVVLGDARLSLEQVPDAAYDVLMVDAFSSDAIPVHLMTTEAVALYFEKLTPTGILILHISNRYLDLAPVIAAIAQAQGLTAAIQHFKPDAHEDTWKSTASTWVIAARQRSELQGLLATGRWEEPAGRPGPLWTDDYSNVVRILKR